jgi:hypothetical protein
MTITEALASFGAKSRNRVSIWSGRSDDGKTVVLSLWLDYIRRVNGRSVYDDFERTDQEVPGWMKLAGNRERIENLVWDSTTLAVSLAWSSPVQKTKPLNLTGLLTATRSSFACTSKR